MIYLQGLEEEDFSSGLSMTKEFDERSCTWKAFERTG